MAYQSAGEMNDKQRQFERDRGRMSQIYSVLHPLALAGDPLPKDMVDEYRTLAARYGRVSGIDELEKEQLRNAKVRNVRLAIGYAMQPNLPNEGTITTLRKQTLMLALLVAKAYGIDPDPKLFGSFFPPTRPVGAETKEQPNEPPADPAEGADSSQDQPAQRVVDSPGD